jgi:hypothetical protein
MNKYRINKNVILIAIALSIFSFKAVAKCSEESVNYADMLINYDTYSCYQNGDTYKNLSRSIKEYLEPIYLSTDGTLDNNTDYQRISENSLNAAILIYESAKRAVDNDAVQLIEPLISESINQLTSRANKAAIVPPPNNWYKPVWIQGGQAWAALIKNLVNNNCVDINSSANSCEALYRETVEALHYVVAMRDVVYYYLDKESRDKLKEIKDKNALWNHYISGYQFQYPWELMLNNCYHNPKFHQIDNSFNKTQCFIPIYGNIKVRRFLQQQPDESFVSPPDSRWIYLHPNVGLYYSDDQSEGDNFSPAITFQWIGSYFNILDEDGERPWGVSLTSVIADLPDSDNHGVGLMFHYRDWGLAVTDHGGDVVYTLNINLLEKFKSLSNSYKNYDGSTSRLTD